MKKLFLVLVLVLIVGGGLYYLANRQKATPVENAMPVVGASGVTEMVVEETPLATGEASEEKGPTKTFTLDTKEFAFSVKEIKVKKGDSVTVTLTNSGAMPHNWVVDEFNANTQTITNGKTDSVTFTADKVGTFEYYCSIGQHRANGMVGKLIVEE